jgi:hypothetical protein
MPRLALVFALAGLMAPLVAGAPPRPSIAPSVVDATVAKIVNNGAVRRWRAPGRDRGASAVRTTATRDLGRVRCGDTSPTTPFRTARLSR